MATTKKGHKVALLSGIALVAFVAILGWAYQGELRAWYIFWREFERLGTNEQGFLEYRHRQTGIIFVRLPGGTFSMGSPDTESDRVEDEGPVHTVTLSLFLVAKYGAPGKVWERGRSCRAT